MAANKGQNVRALVEPVAIDSRTLNDGDLSALSLSNNEQYSSADFETYTSISGDLECINAEEVMTTDEEHVVIEQESETEAESVLPDIEMTDVSDNVQNEQIIYTTANQHNQNIIFQTKPTLQRVPVSTIQMKQHVAQPTQSQSFMIVSPAGGQGNSQILKISHPSGTSPGQLQSLAQTLITAKSADGNIVQLRSTQPNKPIMTTSQSGTITLGNVQGVKTIQSSAIKRPVQAGQQNRNVYTKMILAGNQSQTGQVLFASQGESQQAIKIISNNSSQSVSNTTKTITLAQAQQMGLLGPSKVQHILPHSATQKQGIIVNKLMPSTGSASKMTIVSNSIKSPAKILPAPTIQAKTISSSPTLVSKASMQHPTAQKVIIRQSSLKPGTVLGGGQVIRIPANQNIVTSNQVHQIQMPGRQVQYVRLVSTPATGTSNVVTVGKAKPQATLQTVGVHQKIVPQSQIVKAIRSVTPKGGTGQRLLIPASVGGQGKSAVAIPASALSQLASGQAVISGGSNVGNIVVLPAQYLQQKDDLKVKTLHQSPSSLLNSSQGSLASPGNISIGSYNEGKMSQRSVASSESNGIRPRKPCNCTKSQCLKLYCDCFANGEFCHMCNCNNCSNNLGNEEERQRAIKSCLERNPNAFRPKIGKGRDIGEDIVRRHTKGCNCKRSGCLKNYCECYEAKIPCSGNCKCIGCRNVEETLLTKKSLKDLADAAEVRTAQLTLNKAKMQQYLDSTAFRPAATSNTGARQPFNFLTDKVVEITCQCLMAQADDAERNMLDEETSQKLIIEEFGRCLKEIIESAHKAENI